MDKIKEIINKYKNRYTMYIYYKEQLIKKVKIKDDIEALKESYAINVYFKKHLFLSNKVGLVVVPYLLKKKDDKKRKIYVEVNFCGGVRIE